MLMERGGLEAQPLFAKSSTSLFSPVRRRKINCIAIFLNVFLPWVLFIFCFYAVSFKLFYKYPMHVIAGIVIVGGGIIALCASLAKSEHKGYTAYWYKFATLQFSLSILLAVGLGGWNYGANVMWYYDWERLKTYAAVDPSLELGQNLMDAGTVYWAEGTSIDLTQAWHFMSDKVKHGIHRYCVAPIIKGGAPQTGSYDFWAVGMDCCSASSSDFRCGEFSSGNTRSSLRMMDDEARPYYKLAVQQAEAQYKYKSKHPIFFLWTRDPLDMVQKLMDRGIANYLVAVCGVFCLNVVLVAFATFRFSFIGRLPS